MQVPVHLRKVELVEVHAEFRPLLIGRNTIRQTYIGEDLILILMKAHKAYMSTVRHLGDELGNGHELADTQILERSVYHIGSHILEVLVLVSSVYILVDVVK